MNVELIDRVETFAALHDEWTDLVQASSSQSPFLTWEWLYSWWTHLGGSRRLALVTLRDAGQLIAVAPFCAGFGPVPFFRRWEFLATGFAGSDYLDLIVRQGFEPDAVHHLAEFVRARKVALHLEHLPSPSILSAMSDGLSRDGWSARHAHNGVCPYIRLAGHTWDSFLGTIGRRHRSATGQRQRRLARLFAMRFEPVTDNAMREFVLTKLFEFHDMRFGRHGTAFRSPALRAFHLEATARFLTARMLRLYTLHLNDDLVAIVYGIAFKNRFYYYQHGYDLRFRSQSVGATILELTIRAAIGEGLAEFDLLFGEESYKAALTSERRPLARIECFPPHVGGRIHRAAIETERALRVCARRIIPRHVPQTH